MMNGKAGDHSIESAQGRQRLVHIVSDDANRRFPGEALPNRFQHGWRKVDGHCLGVRVFAPYQFLSNQSQQASVASAKIKDPPRVRRDELKQRRFPLAAMRNGVGSFQIVARMVGRSPQIDGLGGSHEGKVYGNV
jgi:hypothetical protein